MRIYPGTTVDYEFATLGGLGYTGSLNDRQFAALRAEGLTGSLTDMFKQFDGTLGGGGPTLSEQVEAILSGTAGFALDPTDTSTMWQDTGTATPVTTLGDPIGHIRTKWGTTAYDFIQGTAGARPAWDGTRFIDPDGVDDFLRADGSFAVFQNVAGYFVNLRHGGDPGVNASVFFVSTTASGTQRFDLRRTTGRALLQGRRLDGDAACNVQGTDAFNWNGTTVGFQVDLSVTSNGIWLIKNNTDTTNLTMTGSAGNSSNTASVRMQLGSTTIGTPYGRMVVLPRVPTAGERTIIQSWLTEV